MPSLTLPGGSRLTKKAPDVRISVVPHRLKKAGRKPHEPTAATRQMVTVFRSVGVPPDEIAQQIGISRKTLTEHYRNEMAHGQAIIVSRIGAKVVQKALAGDNSMIVFYLRNHGGEAWQDKQRHEVTGADGMPLIPPNLVVSFLMPEQHQEEALTIDHAADAGS